MLLSGCGGPERAPLRGGTEHLLLLHGRELRYEERVGEEVKPYTLRLTYSGGDMVRVFEAQFRGLDFGRCSFISNRTQVFFETNRPTTALQELPEYREAWVDEEAKPGDVWLNEDTGTETAFAGYESISVPAGTFSECYKTVTVGSETLLDSLEVWLARGAIEQGEYDAQMAAAEVVVVRWFASGVGLVREQIGNSDHVRELVAVVRPGTGRVDLPPTE